MEHREKYFSDIRKSARYLKNLVNLDPSIAIILGSGLGDFAIGQPDNISISVSEIPGYPVPTIFGHAGKLFFSRINHTNILSFQGRLHYYESGNLSNALYPIHVASRLGVKKIIITNAAGGINRSYRAGDLMLITDQINLTFKNIHPLLGHRSTQNLKSGLSQQLYDQKMMGLIESIAETKGITLRKGVYCGLLGPSYETTSEIEMIRRMGGDAVGMSTVNEVSLAAELGIRVAGISCITNMSTGILPQKLSHAEVTEVANRVKHRFADLLLGVINSLSR